MIENLQHFFWVTYLYGFCHDYFDILDSAGVDDEEISMPEISIANLREDKHIPFDEKLIEKLNHYKGTYVRAPKMSS